MERVSDPRYKSLQLVEFSASVLKPVFKQADNTGLRIYTEFSDMESLEFVKKMGFTVEAAVDSPFTPKIFIAIRQPSK